MAVISVTFDSSGPRFDWDEKKLEDELDAKGQAQQDAALGAPRDGDEDCLFLTRVNEEAAKVARAAKAELSAHHQAELGNASHQLFADEELRKERDSALGDMAQYCQSGINHVAPFREAVNGVRVEYMNFTIEHGLVGNVAQPKDERAVRWIAGGALLELLLNAWTLGTAHPEGPVGVLPEMFVFMGFNVVAGLGFAHSWRRKNHHSKFRGRSASGWVFLVLLLFLIPVANFVFGHYRDALVSLQQEVVDLQNYIDRWAELFRTALANAFSEEWVPRSMQTVALIFGGMFVAGVAAYKSYHADDPYPGFGKLSRKRIAAQSDYSNEVDKIVGKIKSRADDALGVFGNVASGSVAGPAEADRIRNKFNSWDAEYRSLAQEIVSAGRKQLEIYRDTNRNIKAWPATLDAAFDGFALNAELADPPLAPTILEVHVTAIEPLRQRCDEVIAEARARYQSEVFAPLSALDPNDPNHRRFDNPVAKAAEIKAHIDGMVRTPDGDRHSS